MLMQMLFKMHSIPYWLSNEVGGVGKNIFMIARSQRLNLEGRLRSNFSQLKGEYMANDGDHEPVSELKKHT